MNEFVGEQIDVEQSQYSPRPVRFKWRGEVHDVATVLDCHVDIGFGDMPPRSRRWYTRRHRRYYTVKDGKGEVFEIYLDYANKEKKSWWLTRHGVTSNE